MLRADVIVVEALSLLICYCKGLPRAIGESFEHFPGLRMDGVTTEGPSDPLAGHMLS
jgi:hypothetical protein